ncbi:PAS domain-containing protein [Marinobacter sp. PE14]
MKNQDGYPDAESYDKLRRSAKDLIDHGVAPSSRGGNLGVDALKLLYERASTPESAADALKLLHELQTYQVELDLLYEQLRANEHEINEELAHYKALYEYAPVAYLIVANDGEIIEGNHAAGVLLGQNAPELSGRPLGAFLSPGENVAVDTLLRNCQIEKNTHASFELADRKRVKISAKSTAAGNSILMILTEATTLSAKL